jgi:uncharacterized protein YecT (DUF1311 family)
MNPVTHPNRALIIRGLALGVVALILSRPADLRAQVSTEASCDSAKTPSNMRRCAMREFDRARRDLRRYVAEAHRLATKPALLDSAQALWERFRDLACRAAGSQYDGASNQPVVVLKCMVNATRKRLREVYDDFLRKSRTVLPEPS